MGDPHGPTTELTAHTTIWTGESTELCLITRHGEIRPRLCGGGIGLSRRSRRRVSETPMRSAEIAEMSSTKADKQQQYPSQDPQQDPQQDLPQEEGVRQIQTIIPRAQSIPNPTRRMSSPHRSIPTAAMLKWVNYHLQKWDMDAANLEEDLYDGFLVILLIQIVTDTPMTDFRARLARGEPLVRQDWIGVNHQIIMSWMNSVGLDFNSGDIQVAIPIILKKLLLISFEHTRVSIDLQDPRKTIELLCSSYFDVPYLSCEDNVQTFHSDVVTLLQLSTLADRFKSVGDGKKEKKVNKWVPPPLNYKVVEELEEYVYREGILRIFLSSTFRDMQRERDRFFQHGAVELKKFAKTKGLELVFIDLRWGLTSEDSGNGMVVIRCFESIQECPYFVCFLGARYGWIPDHSKPNEWHPDTYKRYPFLMDIPGKSVTEYEIQYAAFHKPPASCRAFFYFRDEEYAVKNSNDEAEKVLFQPVDDLDRENQNRLKEMIMESYSVLIYRGPVEFSDFVVSNLKFAIEEDFKHCVQRQSEDQAHYQFMMHRLAGFEKREELLTRIENTILRQLNDAHTPMAALAAESGIGKSSLMAAISKLFQSRNDPDIHVITHFVGCTNLSNYIESISIRFWENAARVANLQIESSDENFYMKEGLDGLLLKCQSEKVQKKFIFLIDAVNQLQPSQSYPSPHLLNWLPPKTPPNMAILISTIDTHESAKYAAAAGFDIIPVSRLNEAEISQAASSFLARYDKKLTEQQLSMILEDQKDTGHPLYLRILLDELRVFGVYEKLDAEISTLLATSSVVELYSLIISRWEKKFDKHDDDRMVPTAMKVIYVTRIGLSETELDEYLRSSLGPSFNFAEWKGFFFTLGESLFVRNGRHMYFHQLLIESVKAYYFSDSKTVVEVMKEYGMWLYGNYASNTDIEQELAAEICYQLLNGECFEALVAYLRKDYVIMTMLQGRYRYEFFNCWRVLRGKGVANHKRAYEDKAKELTDTGNVLVEYFLELQESSFLISILLQRLASRADEKTKSTDFMRIGLVYKNLQNWSEAAKYFNRCLELRTKIDYQKDSLQAGLYDEIGDVNLREKSYAQAHGFYAQARSIRESLFGTNHLEVAKSLDNMGRLELAKRKKKKALEFFNNSLEIRLKALGASHPTVATSYTNIGHVHFSTKWMEDALKNYQKAIEIYENTFGKNHPKYAACLMDVSNVYLYQNKVSEALQLLESVVSITGKSLGENYPDVVESLEKIGNIYFDTKQYANSLNAYNKTLRIRKRTLVSDHHEIAKSLENVALLNFVLGSRHQVMELLVEAHQIRVNSRTDPAITSVSQCGELADFSMKSGYPEIAISFWIRGICLRARQDGWKHNNTWRMCRTIADSIEEYAKFQTLVDFWLRIRDLMSRELGWIHEYVWSTCNEVSYAYAHTGKQVQVVALSGAGNLITKLNKFTASKIEKFTRADWVHHLLEIVIKSKDGKAKPADASHAITMLCYLGHVFSGVDLSGVQIPGADLSLSVFNGCSFKKANLRGTKLIDTIMDGCLLDEADLTDIKLGRLVVDTLSGHTNRVNQSCIVTLGDNRPHIVSASSDQSVIVWDHETGAAVKKLSGSPINGAIWSVTSCFAFQPPAEAHPKRRPRRRKQQAEDTPAPEEHGDVKDPDGRRSLIAAGLGSGRLVVWDANSGDVVRTISAHRQSVNSLCAMQGPHGESWIVSVSDDRALSVWDPSSGALICTTADGHPDCVWAVCSMSGPRGESWICTGCCDGAVRVWMLQEPQDMASDSTNQADSMDDSAAETNYQLTLVRTIPGHTDAIYCVCPLTSADDEVLVASASKDGTIRVCNADTGRDVCVLTGHKGPVTGVCALRRGAESSVWLVSSGHDYSVRIWDLSSGTLVKVLDGHTDWATSICPAPASEDGKAVVVSTSRDCTVRLWDVAARVEARQPPGHDMRVNSVVFVTVDSTAADNQATEPVNAESVNAETSRTYIVTGSSDGAVCVWDGDSGAEVVRTKGAFIGKIWAVCPVRGPGREWWVAAGSSNGTVRISQLLTGDVVAQVEMHSQAVNSLALVGTLLACASDDHTIGILDTQTLQRTHSLVGHHAEVWAVCHLHTPISSTSSTSATLASASCDRSICLWSVASGQLLRQIPATHSGSIYGICSVPMPDGRTLVASASQDTTIALWDTVTGEKYTLLRGHSKAVSGVCSFRSPQGRTWLASVSHDETLRIWDLDSHTEVECIHAHTTWATSITSRVTQSGHTQLLTGGCDKAARSWLIRNHPSTQQGSITSEGILGVDRTLCIRNPNLRASIQTLVEHGFVIGPRMLDAKGVSLRSVVGLAPSAKAVLLQRGAISADSSFASHCESQSPSRIQSVALADCYLSGEGVSKDPRKACEILSNLSMQTVLCALARDGCTEALDFVSTE
eukprot:TRINITY_DN2288_c0_g1_i1.p1 TRINITY_DN2288_c0_g1~~TRINITY_DN2288_c0_g1_i1.p1  ORF type:complete len:2402 (+),score=445.90 TRINITY_DN2288_c0_g1_i1:75-7280(+)